MKKTALLVALCLLAVAARAIELSLEENRGDRGSVGYVDIQRLFADSPDAQKAKESFEDLVRQAEERVNLRKAELLKLHHELDQTRAERDALALVMATMPSASTAPAVSASTSAAAVSAPTAPAAVSTSAAPGAVALSTAAPAVPAAPRTRELALPGMSTTDAAPTVAAAALSSPKAAVSSPTAAVAVSSPTAPAAAVSTAPAVSAPKTVSAPPVVLTSTGIAAAAAMFPAAPAPVPVVAAPSGPTPVQRLLEFDGKIIKIQADIAAKESALMHEHDNADRGLLDVESRKTDQVLARLYRAVSEVARREGVSVVIDKTSILYGQPAVDLTDKVLKYLKENPQQ